MTYNDADRLILDAINDAETANYYGGQCEANQREYQTRVMDGESPEAIAAELKGELDLVPDVKFERI